MLLTITIDPSWFAHAEPLQTMLAHIKALEDPAPWTPPPDRLPGDDLADDNDLSALLEGMSDPPPAAPAPAPKSPAIPPPATVPTSGQALYRWLCDRKGLPRATAIGKRRGLDRMITHWSAEDVAAVWTELQAPPAAAPVNGPRRH
jgi:hypothetical protein